ncbi:ribosomal protein L37E [Methanolinea mesophila]|nr:DNA helicase PriA [Methanolinea mesophila]MBP1928091.1 ribosomal protein L37E [Methanolinea mesophila]
MLRHECGYEQDIICRRCGNSMIYNKRLGLYCPKCGHETTLLCPGCGKKW